jgi:acyl-coenzyme A synthetase/AMP-(fatty) acid ligase
MPQTTDAIFILRLLDSFKTNEDKIAVVDQNGQRQTTYRQLLTMALRVAGYLQQKNYPPHSFIGICLSSSMEYVAAEIGIWLAGHAIVPMGEKFPRERIDYIIHHCQSPLLIDDEMIQAMKNTEPTESYVLPHENDINVLFYTSGSTGVPKAVMGTFASYRISPTDEAIIDDEKITVMGITSPMFFVVSKQLFTIIAKGGIANIVPTEIIKDIRLLEDYLAKHQIEYVFMPPSMLTHFSNKSPYLKVVIAAAERLSGISSSDYKIYNYYGQTETGGAIFSYYVDKKYDNTPIGKPDADVEYCILDTEGKPVAQGEEGELCVRGPFASGYYKEPELTEVLYRGGWLHTGDIVYQLPDGNLIFVNRQDWMVKINGQRVEPGEVETAIK